MSFNAARPSLCYFSWIRALTQKTPAAPGRLVDFLWAGLETKNGSAVKWGRSQR